MAAVFQKNKSRATPVPRASQEGLPQLLPVAHGTQRRARVATEAGARVAAGEFLLTRLITGALPAGCAAPAPASVVLTGPFARFLAWIALCNTQFVAYSVNATLRALLGARRTQHFSTNRGA